MSNKRMTREQADKSHKRFKYFVYGYRVFIITYTLFLLGCMMFGEFKWVYLGYLALNATWWTLTIFWLKSNDDTRAMNYRTADRWDDIDRIYAGIGR